MSAFTPKHPPVCAECLRIPERHPYEALIHNQPPLLPAITPKPHPEPAPRGASSLYQERKPSSRTNSTSLIGGGCSLLSPSFPEIGGTYRRADLVPSPASISCAPSAPLGLGPTTAPSPLRRMHRCFLALLALAHLAAPLCTRPALLLSTLGLATPPSQRCHPFHTTSTLPPRESGPSDPAIRFPNSHQ